MAKLKAPLFSLEARGSIGKALVYFPWKGVDAVRTHVVPANPNTALQDAQRTRMEDGVDEWHGATYNALDKTAWNRLANLAASAMSGFNRMIREYVNQDILGNVWTRIHEVVVAAITATGFSVDVEKVSAGLVPTIRWGTSPTNMPTNASMADLTGGSWRYTIPGLTADTLYYFTIDVGASGATWGRVGVYTQRTAAS